MSHNTDARGAHVLADVAHGELVDLLNDRLSPTGRIDLRGELVRNALVELVVATRRNDPLKRCVRTLKGALGVHATGPSVRVLLEKLQADARAPQSSWRPLPAGVSTPVPGQDDAPTRPAAKAVVAHEADATHQVEGPWPRRQR